MGTCCSSGSPSSQPDPRFRRVLWIALVVNATMFGVELEGGIRADSTSLLADAADFLGDAANYGLSLFALTLAPIWRSRTALAKGVSMGIYGVAVIALAAVNLHRGASPEPVAMGVIGIMALLANLSVAILLYRYRTGDANMQSVWLCSRNDAIGNVAVIAAAIGVFGTGSAWPDLIVAMVMATLAINAATKVCRKALREMHLSGNSGAKITQAFKAAISDGHSRMDCGDLQGAYRCYEMAHILGQHRTWLHVESHLAFLHWAHRKRNLREGLGQIPRILAAAMLTWLWVPSGNTGGSRVSALRSMPLPEDLEQILSAASGAEISNRLPDSRPSMATDEAFNPLRRPRE